MLSVALFVFVGWIASVCLHEFGHAIVAYWGGDTSVKEKGYLTLNPLKYTDFSLSLVVPLILLLLGGIPLPGAAVYIEQGRLRGRVWKSAVSFAGPAATALVALVLSLPFGLGWAAATSDYWIWSALAFLVVLEIAGVILNLLPIPSLDGYGILEPWLPDAIRTPLNRWSRYGMLALFALLWFVPDANRVFWQPVYAIATLLQVPPELVWEGHDRFTAWAAPLLVGMVLVAIGGQRFLPKNQSMRGLSREELLYQEETLRPYLQALNEGDRLLQHQEYLEAITYYTQAAQLAPDRYEAWYGRANALLMSEQYEEALTAFDKTIFLQPDFFGAWHGRGLALRGLQQPERALAAYEQGLSLNPEDTYLWSDRGVALLDLGRYDAAIASYDRVLQLKPNNALAYYNQACCLALQGKPSPALEKLRRAVQLEQGYGAIARADADLKTLHQKPEFWAIVGN